MKKNFYGTIMPIGIFVFCILTIIGVVSYGSM